MAPDRESLRLSPGELDILRMLWEEGPLTLSQAHTSFPKFARPIGYPTMQTRLNRLVEKSYVSRSAERPARYRAAVTPEQVGAGHLKDLVEKVGRQSVVPLVAQLISERPLNSNEIAELKRLLAEAEKKGGTRKRRS